MAGSEPLKPYTHRRHCCCFATAATAANTGCGYCCFAAVLRALDRRFEDERGDYMGFASVRDAVFAEVREALDRGATVERS